MKSIIFILLFSVYILVGCNAGEIIEEDTPLVKEVSTDKFDLSINSPQKGKSNNSRKS